MKALDVLRLWIQRSKTVVAIVKHSGPADSLAKMQAEIAVGERIAKVVEAAQAWFTEEFGTVQQAQVEFDKGYLTGKGLELVRLVDALDADEGQAAAPQEEGEHP